MTLVMTKVVAAPGSDDGDGVSALSAADADRSQKEFVLRTGDQTKSSGSIPLTADAKNMMKRLLQGSSRCPNFSQSIESLTFFVIRPAGRAHVVTGARQGRFRTSAGGRVQSVVSAPKAEH